MLYFVLLSMFLAAVVSSQKCHSQPPQLPLQFNTTLLKIGTQQSATPFWWVKNYYSYDLQNPIKNSYHRFDFYDHYLNLDNKWSPVCSILFRDGVTYSIFPADKSHQTEECVLSHSDLPVLHPNWLKGAVCEGVQEFRGLQAEKWRLGETGDGDTIYYYAKTGVEYRDPLRSTNQINDPGATDWFDFTVGPQDPALFAKPKSCSSAAIRAVTVKRGCPPEFDVQQLVIQNK